MPGEKEQGEGHGEGEEDPDRRGDEDGHEHGHGARGDGDGDRDPVRQRHEAHDERADDEVAETHAEEEQGVAAADGAAWPFRESRYRATAERSTGGTERFPMIPFMSTVCAYVAESADLLRRGVA